MNNLKKLFAVAAISAASLTANANDIFLDVGVDWPLIPDGNSLTTDFEALSFDVTATSTLLGGASLPLPGVSFTEDGSGTLIGLSGPTDASDTEGHIFQWNLTASYTGITGYFDAFGLPVFNAGSYVDIFFETGGNSEQVLRLDVAGGGICGAGVCIDGQVNFDFMSEAGYADTTVADPMSFFNFSDQIAGYNSFYDVWTAGQSMYLPLAWNMEFNVDANPYLDDGSGVFSRTTDFTTEVRFQAPEPISVALLAFALLGLGAAKRRKS